MSSEENKINDLMLSIVYFFKTTGNYKSFIATSALENSS